MDAKQLEKAVRAALEQHHDEICAGITAGYGELKTSTAGIEQEFEKAIKSHLPFASTVKRATLEEVGTEQPVTSGRSRGWIDIYIPDTFSGLELKAIRLPRTYKTGLAHRRYDYGQLVADYSRMMGAKRLRWSYLLVLVYGPLVEDASSSGRLYETFHNSMFLDAYIARKFEPRPDKDAEQRRVLSRLQWLKPWLDAKLHPERTFAVQHGKLGVIVIGCRSPDTKLRGRVSRLKYEGPTRICAVPTHGSHASKL